MRYVLSILIPPLGALLFGGLMACVVNILLCLATLCSTLLFGPLLWWMPAVHSCATAARTSK